jgi:anti-anti-sigma factor
VTIRPRETQHSIVLHMAGSMAAGEFAQLHRHLVSLLTSRQNRIVLDFSDVDHISYRDASRLSNEFDLVRSHAGDLKLAGLSPYVRNILILAGLHGLLEMNTPEPERENRTGTARAPLAS